MFPTQKHGCHIFLANALIFMMETIITKEMSSHAFIGSNFHQMIFSLLIQLYKVRHSYEDPIS